MRSIPILGFIVCLFWMLSSSAIAGEVGYASFYKDGRRTANGEKFIPGGMTAAHRSLPFGTKVRITNLRTQKSVVVRINDRGPFAKRRMIDLSLGAASAIGLVRQGIAKVEMVILAPVSLARKKQL